MSNVYKVYYQSDNKQGYRVDRKRYNTREEAEAAARKRRNAGQHAGVERRQSKVA